jgi:hypothetical protein
MRVYNAAIKDRAFTYAIFFLFFCVHIIFCICFWTLETLWSLWCLKMVRAGLSSALRNWLTGFHSALRGIVLSRPPRT